MTRKTIEQNTTEETKFSHTLRDEETKYKKVIENLDINMETLD